MNRDQSDRQPVILGKRYTDIITGITGTATARHEYMYGCVRVSIEWGKDGDVKADVFDEQRLVDERNEKPLATARSGGDRPAPAALPTGQR